MYNTGDLFLGIGGRFQSIDTPVITNYPYVGIYDVKHWNGAFYSILVCSHTELSSA